MKEKVDVLISEKEIENRILEIADRINKDYEGEELTLICVLKGGVMFMCDLAKRLNLNVRLDFMSVSSYGSETKSSGVVKIIKDLDNSIDGKNVLVVEDIIDSGNTLSYLMDILKKRGPKSIKLCTLLDKPSRREKKDVFVDYVCFEIEDKFVVGYGLDFNEIYRNLEYVGIAEPSVFE